MRTDKDMTLNVALCEGRHNIPGATDGAIFKHTIDDPTDVEDLERTAFNSLWLKAFKRDLLELDEEEYEQNGGDPMRIRHGIRINLYVTGLTVALIAALNVCREERLKVTLWHYDRDTNTYFPQEVV